MWEGRTRTEKKVLETKRNDLQRKEHDRHIKIVEIYIERVIKEER